MIKGSVKEQRVQSKECQEKFRSCISSLKTRNESMGSFDHKLLLLKNMADKTAASCQVELEEAEAGCAFWRISCYAFE